MVPEQPDLRRIAAAAVTATLAAATILTLAEGFAASWPVRVAQAIAVFCFGAIVIVTVVGLIVLRLAGWGDSDEEFDRLVVQSEALALGEELDPAEFASRVENFGLSRRREFDANLRRVLDTLPGEMHRALEHVEITVVPSAAAGVRVGRARRLGPYGMVRTDNDSGEAFSQWILLFRERLMRDFGEDHELLRLQLHNMLSQELSRVLAAHTRTPSERGVRRGS